MPAGTVDVWARIIAVVGALVAVLGLALQYLQHRQKRPRLRLEVGPHERWATATDDSKAAYGLRFHLSNTGGLGTGIAEVRHFNVREEHQVRRGSFAVVGKAGGSGEVERPEEGFLAPSDHMSWYEVVVLTPPAKGDVHIRTEVIPITGENASVSYTLPKSPEPGGEFIRW